MRKSRRRGIGRSMAIFLWNEHPGDWLVRVLEANAPALAFWRCGISIYSLGSYNEEEHTVDGRPWRFFRFVSNRANLCLSSSAKSAMYISIHSVDQRCPLIGRACPVCAARRHA